MVLRAFLGPRTAGRCLAVPRMQPRWWQQSGVGSDTLRACGRAAVPVGGPHVQQRKWRREVVRIFGGCCGGAARRRPAGKLRIQFFGLVLSELAFGAREPTFHAVLLCRPGASRETVPVPAASSSAASGLRRPPPREGAAAGVRAHGRALGRSGCSSCTSPLPACCRWSPASQLQTAVNQ